MSHPALYDAIVVGSGATGGVAAKQLAEGGLRVLVLEAGRNFPGGARHGSPMTNLMRQLYRHFVTGRQRVQERQGGYWETNPDLFVDDIDHPYVTPADRPYRWIRGRHLGGRSLSWGGVTLRFSDFEFKAASRDGIGEDWPIGYQDLEPFYAEVEQFLGTHGSKEGLAQLPDGAFREPRPMTPAEQRLAAAVTRFPDRRAIISRGIRAGRYPARGERFSRLSSPATTLAAALATGRTTVQTGAVVSKLLVNGGRATAVEYIDAASRQVHEAHGRVIFLCASTIESLRILMNSRSPAHPEGLGASSGVLGRYLMDHIVGNVWFSMPGFQDNGRYDLTGADSHRSSRVFKTLARSVSPGCGASGCGAESSACPSRGCCARRATSLWASSARWPRRSPTRIIACTSMKAKKMSSACRSPISRAPGRTTT